MKKQNLLTILIPTFICVIAWIGFNVYHSGITTTISQQELDQVTPINPSFNEKIISELKKREQIEPYFQATPSSKLLSAPIIRISVVTSSTSAKTTGGRIIK